MTIKVKRIVYDLEPKACKQWYDIRKRSGLDSNAELLKRVTSVYEYFLRCQEKGAKIYILDKNITTEIELCLGESNQSFKARNEEV